MNCCPHGRRNYTCVLLPLYLLSDLPPSHLPKLKCTLYTDSVWLLGGGGGGGVELCFRPYSAGVLHSVSDQIQNLPNCFTTLNKMTSEDDIKGLVSLKFLRPWEQESSTNPISCPCDYFDYQSHKQFYKDLDPNGVLCRVVT